MLVVIKPFCSEFSRETRMDRVLEKAVEGYKVKYLLKAEELEKEKLEGKKIIFAVCLSESGINLEYYRILDFLRRNPGCLSGSVCGIIVDGNGELFTKALGRRLALSANIAGATFPGKPLVEATGSLRNFDIMSKVLEMENLKAYEKMAKDLVTKVYNFKEEPASKKNILVVHASSRKTSNSLLLWDNVKEYIKEEAPETQFTEVSLRNGDLLDCRGCKYEDCLHFGEKGECFYGGVMVEKVYPAIVKCNCLVMVCPNYNDAVSANITAFINRLTAVFRTNDFSKKKVFALVISGYSGGDIVAEQIISAMNFNKNFILPGRFALIETANDPGSILKVPGFNEESKAMAMRILK